MLYIQGGVASHKIDVSSCAPMIVNSLPFIAWLGVTLDDSPSSPLRLSIIDLFSFFSAHPMPFLSHTSAETNQAEAVYPALSGIALLTAALAVMSSLASPMKMVKELSSRPMM